MIVPMKRKTKKSSGDRNKRVVVNDRIQKGYCYELSAPVGRTLIQSSNLN